MKIIPPKHRKGPEYTGGLAVRYELRPDGWYVYTRDKGLLKYSAGRWIDPKRVFELIKSQPFFGERLV